MEHQLLIVVAACLAGFYMAWNIGANDVANAMGTSVGSKALTLKNAVIIAAIFELAGAVLVGGHVTETVRKGIVSPTAFSADPNLYILGMLAALLAAAIWLHVATMMGLPVSTTHSIVGAVAGFGMCAGGLSVVQWDKMGQIVLSWFTSPVCGGIIAFLVFTSVGKGILDDQHPVKRARVLTPVFVFITLFVITLAVVFKGLKNLSLNLDFPDASLIAAGIGALGALISHFFTSRFLTGKEELSLGDQYRAVEKVFRFLQIMTAAAVAFAHGSNDVANAVGPLAGIISAVEQNEVAAKAAVPFWILALGGVGIVFGLSVWGYRVIYTIGSKITDLTPTRGFSAELAASITIILGSRLGMPVSTTHILVGSVIGVGFARGMAALNLRVIRDIFTSWIITVPLTGLLAAGIFLFLRATLL